MLKNSKNTSKLLLDTSFLLFTLGIEVEGVSVKPLSKMRNTGYTFYYSMFNILEALRVAINVSRRGKVDGRRFESGLTGIIVSGAYKK